MRKIIATELPLEKIQPNELNDYDVSDPDEVLKSSIAAFGMDSALAVIGPFEGDVYRLIAGERRFHAISAINKESNGEQFSTVPVVIVGDSNMDVETQVAKIQISNLITRKLSSESVREHGYTLFRTLKTLQKNGTIKSAVKEFAQLLNQSERTAQMYQKVVDVDDEIEGFADAVTAEKIPLLKAGQIGARLQNADEETKNAIKNERGTLKERLAAAKTPEEKQKIITESALGTAIAEEYNNLTSITKKTQEDTKGFHPLEDSFRSTVSDSLEEKEYQEGEDIFSDNETSYRDVPTAEDILYDEQGIRHNNTSNVSNRIAEIEEQTFRQKMIRWCNALLEKDEISKDDEEVVEVFRKVTDKF